ncbi:GDPGTP exchange factor Sec2p [Penicillium cf. griseofulvum]|uniref:GDPGTP exchange factor Sec2p n=1 Tax=Penicillium cf. griseofulvum TaxID=2972120 RepID=A0A9W9MFD0_9EURO|nr:GDPGTP exchange factor Sec2p [Penicillium cf. griseofulvum]
MSTTLTTLVAPMKNVSEKQCPMCWGEGILQDGSGAHDRIQELEGQVHALTARASATASKLSEYEDEVRRLRSSQSQGSYHTPRSSSSLGRPPSQIDQSPQRPTTSDSQPQTYHSRLTNLASLLPYRRGSAAPASAPVTSNGLPTTPTALTTPIPHMSPANSEHTAELQDALTREQKLREAAESQLSQASTELEELTVQLFSQANEMVAEERRARAKLEERVAVLEKRDVEKRSRLERLEKAVARVERLRALVNHQ